MASIKPIRLSLRKLNASDKFTSMVSNLKSEGYLDWQILNIIMNLLINYKFQTIRGNLLDKKSQQKLLKELVLSEEKMDDVRGKSGYVCSWVTSDLKQAKTLTTYSL